MRTNRQKHCNLWLVLIHGLTDTVVEFDSDRCFFLLWLPNFRKFCMSKHSCSYVIIVPWNNIKKRLLLTIFLCREGSGKSVHFHRLTWVFILVLKYHVLAQKNDLCTVYKNSECCGEAAPATMAHLGNHQCVVSMRQKMLPVRCKKIQGRARGQILDIFKKC